MLEAGVLLGAAYVVTGRLWLPIGLHIGWNFTKGSVYGMQISGNTADTGLLHGSLTGPRLLTGGAFGPEASIVAVVLCLLVAAYRLARYEARPHRATCLDQSLRSRQRNFGECITSDGDREKRDTKRFCVSSRLILAEQYPRSSAAALFLPRFFSARSVFSVSSV
jgi:hypothetical protein